MEHSRNCIVNFSIKGGVLPKTSEIEEIEKIKKTKSKSHYNWNIKILKRSYGGLLSKP